MRRIAVFDTGWGGELVADYLARELSVVEVVRVIDWGHKVYSGLALDIDAVIQCLVPYIGRVDAIVLGGYTVGIMLQALRSAYPEQIFVAPSINYDRILRTRQYPGKVAVLMNDMARESRMFHELREKLPYSTLILPECANWEYLIDNNLMTNETVRTELAWDFEMCPAKELSASRMQREREVEFSSLDILAERSSEKRALMRAIQNFGVAARQVSLAEEYAAKEAEWAQKECLANDSNRVRTRPDLVLLLNTHFWEIKPEIEKSLGWQVRVLDFREKLLHDVCAALKLRGVDGKRPK